MIKIPETPIDVECDMTPMYMAHTPSINDTILTGDLTWNYQDIAQAII